MRSLFRKIPIQLSTAIIVLLAMTALIAGLGWIVSKSVESTFRSEVEREQRAFLDNYAEQIDAKLNVSRAALEAVARRVTFTLFEDAVAAQAFVDSQDALHVIFDNGLYLVANDGIIIAQSPFLPTDSNRNISSREYFQVPTQTSKPYISRPYASELSSGCPAVTIVVPVFSNKGVMIGRLHGSFKLLGSNFLGSFPKKTFGGNGYLYLVDDNRTVIVHPDRSRILDSAAAPGVNQMLEHGLKGFDGSGGTVTSYGVHQLATTKWLKTVRWLLISNYPMEALLQPVWKIRTRMILAGVIGMMITLTLLLLALSRITKPLSSLTRHLERMPGDGNAAFLPNAFSSAEIWKLTHSFDTLFHKLSDRETRTRESEGKFRAIFECSPIAIAIHRVCDGIVIDLNPAFEFITGYRAAEVTGRPFSDYIHPADIAKRSNALESLMSEGRINNQEMVSKHKNGTQANVLYSAATFQINDEPYAVSTVLDITDQLHTAQALHQRQEELVALNQLARAVASKLSLEAVCQAAVEKVAEVLVLDTTLLFILKENELFLMASGPNPPVLPVATTPVHRLGECLCGQAACKSQSIFCRSIRDDARCTWQECKDAGIHSFAAIPLCFDDQVMGVMGVGSMTERDLEKSARFLETAADHLAISIHNAHAFEETCNYAAQLQQYIGERELTQQAIKENERRLSLAMSATADAIWEWNLITDETYYSPRWYEMLGYTNGELPMSIDTWRMLCHPEDWPACVERFQTVTADSTRFSFECRLQAKNGFWLWILTRGNVVEKDADDRPTILTGTNSDITQNKKAELALKANESMLRSIFQAVPLAISVIRDNRVLESVNDGMISMFGYSYDEVIGRNVRFLYFTDEEYEQTGIQLYQKGRKHDVTTEANMRRKDGVRIQVLLSASLLEPENPAVGAVVVLMDITHRKRLEEQLRQAQKAEAIGQLAGGIAHDFNNILGGILGFTELALGQIAGNPAKAEGSMQRVLQAGYRAKDLVDQILRFSRQDEPTLTQLDLTDIVQEVLNLMQAALPANIEIRRNICPDLPNLRADASQIHQLVMNLCTNAFHAMRGSAGVLTLSLDRYDACEPISCRNRNLFPGTYLRLNVSDTGHGIDPLDLERIFDPYFTTKEKGEGTGLGLSVTLGIIDNHGGGIQVESLNNEGTTFSIYLPESTIHAETKAPGRPEIPKGTERILFVDDESLFIEMSKDVLSGLGYQVTCMQSSVEALDRFIRSPESFDLVISDQTMPKMTGLELIEQLKRIRPEIPVIICTGFSENIQNGDTLHPGISKVLYKPYSLIDIATAIREALNNG